MTNQKVQLLIFPFGMIQTPYQIILNWPVKFRNNIDDSPKNFLSNLLRFKNGYKIDLGYNIIVECYPDPSEFYMGSWYSNYIILIGKWDLTGFTRIPSGTSI